MKALLLTGLIDQLYFPLKIRRKNLKIFAPGQKNIS